ncbi:hypothetical protein LMG32289_00151 [Cupriavidus pampae]|uniref:Uncharacterized protein n=1 Tax=Cupriavidus pampae TaxID=659251 RepID=A0ABM8W919_9BURK|nr:hypothetical protein LMG32289_00151 [Cupriavidus pampae]
MARPRSISLRHRRKISCRLARMAIFQSTPTALSIAVSATRGSTGVESHGPAITATTIKSITKAIP